MTRAGERRHELRKKAREYHGRPFSAEPPAGKGVFFAEKGAGVSAACGRKGRADSGGRAYPEGLFPASAGAAWGFSGEEREERKAQNILLLLKKGRKEAFF